MCMITIKCTYFSGVGRLEDMQQRATCIYLLAHTEFFNFYLLPPTAKADHQLLVLNTNFDDYSLVLLAGYC